MKRQFFLLSAVSLLCIATSTAQSLRTYTAPKDIYTEVELGFMALTGQLRFNVAPQQSLGLRAIAAFPFYAYIAGVGIEYRNYWQGVPAPAHGEVRITPFFRAMLQWDGANMIAGHKPGESGYWDHGFSLAAGVSWEFSFRSLFFRPTLLLAMGGHSREEYSLSAIAGRSLTYSLLNTTIGFRF